jgi:hypothetical protein
MISRDELLRIAEWHEHQLEFLPDHIHIPVRDFHVKAAAAIRELLEQEPVAWLHIDGKDAIPAYKKQDDWTAYSEPLYAEPIVASTNLHETDIYNFAGWLTGRPGVMPVGSTSDAALIVDAVDEYIKTFPERFTAPANEADDLLRKLGLDPECYRTDGGTINHMKVAAAVRNPDKYPVSAPNRTDLSRMALTWYDTQQSEDGLNRDAFHLFVLELIDTLILPAAAPAQATCFKCGHAAHSGECVNVSPAQATWTQEQIDAVWKDADKLLPKLKEKL